MHRINARLRYLAWLIWFLSVVVVGVASASGPVSPLRVWLLDCAPSGAPSVSVDVYDLARNGTKLRSLPFPSMVCGGSVPFFGKLRTSTDQQHVYASMESNGQDEIVDVATATYSVRHFPIPMLAANGIIADFVISPNGQRLYVSVQTKNGTGSLYVLDARSGRILTSRPFSMNPVEISQSGATLFGFTGSGLVAVDTTTFSRHVVGRLPCCTTLRVSRGQLFALSANDVVIYDEATLRYVADIRVRVYPIVGLGTAIADNDLGRLYVTAEYPNGGVSVALIDTATDRLITRAWRNVVYSDQFSSAVFADDPLTHTVFVDDAGNLCHIEQREIPGYCLWKIRLSTTIGLTTTN